MTPAGLPDLVILRHGETEWNAARRWQGAFDSPLTARGVAQARAVGARLARLGIGPGTHRLLVSPQPRARRTALLAFGREGEGDPRLREIGVGDWAGWTLDAIAADPRCPRGPDPLRLYEAAPGGEGTAALRGRCASLLASLDGPAILVTHGMTGRVLRLLARGLPMDRLPDLGDGQGTAFRIRAGREEALAPAAEDRGAPGRAARPGAS